MTRLILSLFSTATLSKQNLHEYEFTCLHTTELFKGNFVNTRLQACSLSTVVSGSRSFQIRYFVLRLIFIYCKKNPLVTDLIFRSWKEQEVLCRTHKAYFPTGQTSSSIQLLLFILGLHLRNWNLSSDNKIQFNSWVIVLRLCLDGHMIESSSSRKLLLFTIADMLHKPSLKVKLSLYLTNEALRHEGVWGNGCIDPYSLDLGTSWRWVVSFTPRPLYPRYPLDRRQGGPYSRSGRRGEEKIFDPTGTWNLTTRASSP
jgi:hypothetical protein